MILKKLNKNSKKKKKKNKKINQIISVYQKKIKQKSRKYFYCNKILIIRILIKSKIKNKIKIMKITLLMIITQMIQKKLKNQLCKLTNFLNMSFKKDFKIKKVKDLKVQI